MSGDLNQVHSQMVTNEFIQILKSLSVPESNVVYADAIELLYNQLKKATENGLSKNHPFALSLITNFHYLVPIFGDVLCNTDPNDRSFRYTVAFLETLSDAFYGICLFDVFSKVKEKSLLETIFHNNVVLLKEIYFTDNNKYDHLTTCLIPVVGLSSLLITVKEADVPPNLLAHLLAFTNVHWLSEDRDRVVQYILILLKAFSKKPTLVPMIIRCGWPQACVQWLKGGDAVANKRPSFRIDYHICLVLQKLARHNIGVEALNQVDCIKALEQSRQSMKRDHTEEEFSCINFLQCMIYALLMEADQIKQMSLLNDVHMCQVLEQVILYTIEASRDEFFMHKCFHVSEVLNVLCKLFVNDDILTKCINENKQLFDCLCQLMMHFASFNVDAHRTPQPTDDETLLTLSNLLWSISFHQCYQERFRVNTMLMHTLSNLASSTQSSGGTQAKSVPRDMCSLKKAAEGIMWNLKSSTSAPAATTPSSEKTEKQPLAMISYCHSDASFCRELVERLSAHVPVWVDYKQAHDAIAHSDDLWEEIARAMEMATVIVLIVSKEYYDSKSCRQELSYATDALRKRIVPVYAPYQQYRASGWLGIRIAGQKYIHFGRKLFTDAVNELASMVLNEQTPAVVQYSTPPLSLPAPVVSASEACPHAAIEIPEEAVQGDCKLSTLNEWTKEDIRKWFGDNQVHADLLTLYADRFRTGTALVVYARHLKCFYRSEFIRIHAKYYDTFDGKRLDTIDFVNFVDALYRLRAEYDPNCTTEDKYANQQLPVYEKTLTDGMTWL